VTHQRGTTDPDPSRAVLTELHPCCITPKHIDQPLQTNAHRQLGAGGGAAGRAVRVAAGAHGRRGADTRAARGQRLRAGRHGRWLSLSAFSSFPWWQGGAGLSSFKGTARQLKRALGYLEQLRARVQPSALHPSPMPVQAHQSYTVAPKHKMLTQRDILQISFSVADLRKRELKEQQDLQGAYALVFGGHQQSDAAGEHIMFCTPSVTAGRAHYQLGAHMGGSAP